jgi:transcriptional regulator with XRE-family HTH domain
MSSLAPAAYLGIVIADARRRRGWPLRELAARAGISVGGLHAIEHGRAASLETYAAIGRALGRELHVDLIDPRRRAATAGLEDPVHAAMGEAIARQLAAQGRVVAIDEPYQHYQFAGRADLLAWDADALHLLHVENRARFPNVQEAVGSFNAKRRYLPAVTAERLGRGSRGFATVTHAIVALWSSEAIHAVRLHPATFAAVCPDPPDAFEAWWGGALPGSTANGVTSTLVLFDPAPASARHRPLSTLTDATRPRYRGYADAARAVSRGASSRS